MAIKTVEHLHFIYYFNRTFSYIGGRPEADPLPVRNLILFQNLLEFVELSEFLSRKYSAFAFLIETVLINEICF